LKQLGEFIPEISVSWAKSAILFVRQWSNVQTACVNTVGCQHRGKWLGSQWTTSSLAAKAGRRNWRIWLCPARDATVTGRPIWRKQIQLQAMKSPLRPSNPGLGRPFRMVPWHCTHHRRHYAVRSSHHWEIENEPPTDGWNPQLPEWSDAGLRTCTSVINYQKNVAAWISVKRSCTAQCITSSFSESGYNYLHSSLLLPLATARPDARIPPEITESIATGRAPVVFSFGGYW